MTPPNAFWQSALFGAPDRQVLTETFLRMPEQNSGEFELSFSPPRFGRLDTASFVCLVALAVELYHLIQHVLILSIFKVLQEGDDRKEPAYAIFDSAGVLAALLVHRQHAWLAALHVAQHFYYYVAWNSSWTTETMTAATSLVLNWTDKRVVEANELGQTVFDIFVHFLNVAVLLRLLIVSGCAGFELLTMVAVVGVCTFSSINIPQLALLRHPWLK